MVDFGQKADLWSVLAADEADQLEHRLKDYKVLVRVAVVKRVVRVGQRACQQQYLCPLRLIDEKLALFRRDYPSPCWQRQLQPEMRSFAVVVLVSVVAASEQFDLQASQHQARLGLHTAAADPVGCMIRLDHAIFVDSRLGDWEFLESVEVYSLFVV